MVQKNKKLENFPLVVNLKIIRSRSASIHTPFLLFSYLDKFSGDQDGLGRAKCAYMFRISLQVQTLCKQWQIIWHHGIIFATTNTKYDGMRCRLCRFLYFLEQILGRAGPGPWGCIIFRATRDNLFKKKLYILEAHEFSWTQFQT